MSRIMTTGRMSVWVAAAAMLAMTGVGCNDPVKAPPAGQADLVPDSQYPQIVATEGLANGLRFGEPKVRRGTAEQPMKVTVPVRSVEDDYPLNVQYRFEFLDGEGRPLDVSQRWRFANLQPRVQRFLEATALETKASDWRLIIRSAR